MALVRVNGVYQFGPLPPATTGARLVPSLDPRNTVSNVPNPNARVAVPDRSSSLGNQGAVKNDSRFLARQPTWRLDNGSV